MIWCEWWILNNGSHTFKTVPRKMVEITTPGPASKIICAIHLCVQSKAYKNSLWVDKNLYNMHNKVNKPVHKHVKGNNL